MSGSLPTEEPPPTTEQERAARYVKTAADPTYNPVLRKLINQLIYQACIIPMLHKFRFRLVLHFMLHRRLFSWPRMCSALCNYYLSFCIIVLFQISVCCRESAVDFPFDHLLELFSFQALKGLCLFVARAREKCAHSLKAARLCSASRCHHLKVQTFEHTDSSPLILTSICISSSSRSHAAP